MFFYQRQIESKPFDCGQILPDKSVDISSGHNRHLTKSLCGRS